MISTGASSRTGLALSRVTLVGERRRVDLVLPSQEPIGRLLPEVMRLLDDRVGTRPQTRHLVAGDGSVLDPDATLESAAVADGAVLRLVRVEDAPSAPVVHDVTDEAADDLDVRAWRWRPAARRVVAGGATVGWALAASFLARQAFGAQSVGAVLLVVAALATAAGAAFGRAGLRGLAGTLVVTGGALGVFGVWSLGDAQGWSGAVRLAGVAGVAAVSLLLLGWCSPLGRAGVFGAAALVGGGLCWEGALAFQSAGRAGALLAVVSVVVLGLLPRFALMASGLSGLDDRRSGGASVSRYQVSTALAATHRGLVLATIVTAVSAAVAGVLVLRTATVWTVLLAMAVTLVLALRARAYPLVPEVVSLFVAAVVVAVRLAWVWLEQSDAVGPLAVLIVLAVVPLAVLVVQPPEHVRVRLRRFGDVLESVGVIALFPLVIGVFGVYGRLLGTFA
ncbi:type VII secretion integral membrane protein EccD [Streptomyces coacervatus]|uniref:type VII secretion integral membrane protein EccD n=1 Tax=Streptomyces coacervatus TaxID=647381 RepID=UPI0023DA1C58|nr:type VII secretion integral membrane protein EccD [Streptomyces coacervatus]MDF2272644.1 type VII secretion integral membrane protein EccD [Streptomyces coacervatus]